MKSIEELENEIIQELAAFTTIDEKYAHLFKLGQSLPDMDPSLKTDSNLVKGCQSNLWFFITCKEGQMHLDADSDSMLIKGISALLVRLVEKQGPEEVLTINLDFLDRFSIWKMAARQNPSLNAILEHLYQFAKLEITPFGNDLTLREIRT
jgi:cysteine desulfuration protein SufE